MFGDIDNKPSRWTIAKIQDIAKCVAGATPSTSKHEYWENGTIPWLSSGEVNKYRIYETNTKITRLGYDSTSTKLVPPHTVVLAMAGQGKTRGTAAMAEIELCTNQSICSLVTNKKMNPDFLLFYLKEQYEQLRAASNGEGGRGGLNLKIIGAFPIMVPPIELQNKFATFVEQVDKSKFIYHSKYFLCDIFTLFSSTIAYSRVVSIFACPNIFCTCSIGMPLSIAFVANVLLNL